MNQSIFSPDELSRYARHFSLDCIGFEGQQRLKNSAVCCVGAGGLGAPVLLYLAAAGVGKIGIVDFDHVELSNLQRQVLFTVDDLNDSKVRATQRRLKYLNPNIEVIAFEEKLQDSNVFSIFSEYDVIVDCSDNFPTRYLVNDACFHLKKPYIYASIFQFEGQCTVFCAPNGPCYRCLYESPLPAAMIPNCAEAGVLGVLPGLLGSIQAVETIKILLSLNKPLIGRLLTVNALSMEFREFKLARSQTCPLCQYQQPFNSLSRDTIKSCSLNTINEVSSHILKQWIDKKEITVLDVREHYETEICRLNSQHIPLNELSSRLNELDQTKPIVVYCKAGPRSHKACQLLQEAGINDVAILKGGILSWIDEIDSTLIKY